MNVLERGNGVREIILMASVKTLLRNGVGMIEGMNRGTGSSSI